MLLSSDQENDSDVLAITGASFALGISDIPFPIPIAAVRVGLTPERRVPDQPDLPAARELAPEPDRRRLRRGGRDGRGRRAARSPKTEMLEASSAATTRSRRSSRCRRRLIAEIGKPKREVADAVRARGPARQRLTRRVEGAARRGDAHQGQDRELRQGRRAQGRDDGEPSDEDQPEEIDVRQAVLARPAGHRPARGGPGAGASGSTAGASTRSATSTCEVGVLPRTHGSALFTRGETQALVTVTLGTSADAQRLDFVEGESKRRFMLHYNFPPFSVGEARFLRGPGRREIGHGALGERSLLPMMPAEDDWPYTIRIVSDILESNGSSSMATICGGSLALMDAGVPLKRAGGRDRDGSGQGGRPVRRADRHRRRRGSSRRHGLQGRRHRETGITGLQMDIKITGITREIIGQALEQARQRTSGHPRRDERRAPVGRATTSRRTRRASSRSRSTRTRSATSSGPAAR